MTNVLILIWMKISRISDFIDLWYTKSALISLPDCIQKRSLLDQPYNECEISSLKNYYYIDRINARAIQAIHNRST